MRGLRRAASSPGRAPQPTCILLDEWKAHPTVFNVLLQVLDDERFRRPGCGVASRTIIIMTNVGTASLHHPAPMPRATQKVQKLVSVRYANLQASFLNRITWWSSSR